MATAVRIEEAAGKRDARTTFTVLGVRVDAVQIPEAIARMEEWIARRDATKYVAVTGMHGVTEALHDEEFKKILNGAGMAVADGYPLVVLGRRKGFALPRRVYGPELMEEFLAKTEGKGYRHFFYGGAEGVAEELARRMKNRFPGTLVAGTYGPPFRALTPAEEAEVAKRIGESCADIVWVGLSTPKQERWMARMRERLEAPVLVGVGAAFDFHTGRVRRAPKWMGEHGLEWAFRLAMEPARLWRRYLVYGSEFALHVAMEELRIRKYE